MKERGQGAIVNIGSISGRSTKHERPNMAAYGTAKAAVMNLTFHMANQWGPEVRGQRRGAGDHRYSAAGRDEPGADGVGRA